MSVIVILLLPLVATALVCLPFKRQWAAGVTVVSCLTILRFGRASGMAGLSGQLRHGCVESGNAKMDCCGRVERADSAA